MDKPISLRLRRGITKIIEFANSVDPDKAAHNELPFLDLHFLPASLLILNMI